MYSVENVEDLIKPWITSKDFFLVALGRENYYSLDVGVITKLSKFEIFTSSKNDHHSRFDRRWKVLCLASSEDDIKAKLPRLTEARIQRLLSPVEIPTIQDINHIIANEFLTFFDFEENSFSKQVNELTIEKMDDIHGKYRTWKETGKTQLDSFEKGIVEGFQPISIQTFMKSYGPCDLDEKLAQLKLEIVQKAYLPNTYRLCGYVSIDEIKRFIQRYTLDIQNHIVKPKLDEIKYVDLKDVRRVLLEERKNHELELKEKINSLITSHENELKSINEHLETLNQDLKRVQDARDDLQVKLKEEQTKNSSLSETNKKLQEENLKLKNQLKIIFDMKEELENPSKLAEHHERLNLVENIVAEDHERLNRMVYED